MLRSRLLSLYFVLLIKKNKYLVSYLAGLLVVGMAITASYLLLDRKIVLTRQPSRRWNWAMSKAYWLNELTIYPTVMLSVLKVFLKTA